MATAEAANPVFVGQWPGGNRGPIQSVTVRSNLAYCAIAESGLAVLTLNGTTDPTWLGGIDTTGCALDVAVQGDYAFVADNNAGLRVFSITNPAAPTSVGTWTNCDRAKALQVIGNYAFLADGTNGLQVISVIDPAAPVRVGIVGGLTNGFAEGIAISGTNAYVAIGAGGVLLIDISNPSAPSRTSRFDTVGYAGGIAVSGNYLFVADGHAGLRVLDVSNPQNPSEVAFLVTGGFAERVAVYSNYVCVADSDKGLKVIDVTNPAAPVLVGSYFGEDWATGVTVHEDRAYVASVACLDIINLSTPVQPIRLANYNSAGDAVGIGLLNDRAYVTDSRAGLHVLDVSNPAAPFRVNKVGEVAYGLSIVADRAYVATEGQGLAVLDLTNSAAPLSLGEFETTNFIYGVEAVPPLAYVANGKSFKVVNALNPSMLSQLATTNIAGIAYGVAVSGNHAYVAGGTAGLFIFDVSNPMAPALKATNTPGGSVESVLVVSNRAYVAASGSGVRILNISNPTNPVLVGTYSATQAAGLALVDDVLFVANGQSGLLVLSITNEASPTLIGSYDTAGFAEKVFLHGNYAFVADGPAGVTILQVYGFPGDAPRIVRQPQRQIVRENSSAKFRISAQGEEPLSYQWRLNGGDLPGATDASLLLENVSQLDVGNYSVVVSNVHGVVTSSTASLALLNPIAFAASGPNAPRIVSTNFQFGLPTQSGVTYVVEYTDVLGDPWNVLRVLRGDGATLLITSSTNGIPRRFFRLAAP